jgi:hypothetical protein
MKIKPLMLLGIGTTALVAVLAALHQPATAPEPARLSPRLSQDTVETMATHGIELNDAAAPDTVRATPAAYQPPPR